MGETSQVSRRQFVAGAAALAAAARLGCGPAAAQPAVAGRLGDAHVHLFNLADLPAVGFFEHGVLWNTQLSSWLARPVWPALLDLIAFFKAKTLTAEDELAAYRPGDKPRESIDKNQFRANALSRISNMARQSALYGGARRVAPDAPLSAPQRSLRDSYHQLNFLIDLAGKRRDPQGEPETPARAVLDDAAIGRIRAGAQDIFVRDCPEEPHATGNMGPRENVVKTIEWAWLMVQPRLYHLSQYLETIAEGDLRPKTVVNLLVDYDAWLGDEPAPGSSHDKQICFWDRIRRDFHSDLDLRTFAGFDPLKDALEHEGLGGGDRYEAESRFWASRRAYDQQTIQGFKLYPPMGFRPIGNDASVFRNRRRALRGVRERWQAAGLRWERLPELLDASLARFYRYCSERRIPIVAHAAHTNEASRCVAQSASPSHWERVIADNPGLRLCLAHFADAREFERGRTLAAQGRAIPPRIWAFHGTPALLALNNERVSRVFVDLSYMSEFLNEERGSQWVVEFFRSLKGFCTNNDPGCRHFVFGSDWIMLAREARSDSYLARMREGMSRAGWDPEWQDRLLYGNLQRFVGGKTD